MDMELECFDCSLGGAPVLIPVGDFGFHNNDCHSTATEGCRYCPVRFYDKNDRVAHEQSEHVVFPCIECFRLKGIVLLMERSKFDDHYFEEHKLCKLPCPECPNYFTTPRILGRHFDVWHANLQTSTKKKCLNCDSILEKKDMRSHNLSNHRGLKEECPKCFTAFGSPGERKIHQKGCKA